METVFQDVRYGIRMLVRSPRFAAVSLAVLGLGIGATTAIFSVASVAMFRPLPFPDPARITWIWDVQPQAGRTPLSYPEFTDIRDRNEVFESIAAIQEGGANLTGTGDPVRLNQARVSSDFFNVMGMTPRIGRSFLPEEDTLGGNKVAILSRKLWQQRFGASQDIIGKTIQLDGVEHTIVGVMPNESPFLADVEAWAPLAADPKVMLRGLHFLKVVARLKPGATIGQAGANLDTVAAALQKQYSTDHGINVVLLSEYLFGDARPVLLIFLGAVGFVLLIAWANIANLQLVRATARQREIAIRVAVGAGRSRLIRQLLTESVVLSLVGAALGVLLALAGVPLLIAFSPEQTPWVKMARVDPAVLAFALGVSVVTGIVFGLLPALQASKPDLVESLKEGTKSSAGSQGAMRSLLVTVEIALALVLLVGAGLTLRSFSQLIGIHPGFNPDNVLTMTLNLPASKYKDDRQQAQFYKEVLDRISALPGIESAGIINSLPLSGESTNGDVEIQGYTPSSAADSPLSEKYLTSPDYFRTMGIPLLKGRLFTAADSAGAHPVAIINDGMANRFWPGENPIGKQIKFGWLNEDRQEVIGVVGDVKNQSLDATTPLETYLPYSQASLFRMSLVVKTKGDPLTAVATVRGQVLSIDPDQPVYNVNSLSKVVSGSLSERKSVLFVLGLFASLALILAAVGIYGVISYWVGQRTREIGIRMALGATRQTVLGMIVGQGARVILIGVTVGLAAAFALTRLMSGLLFGVSPTDPLVFAAIPGILVMIGLLASYVPAIRATKVDPMAALRYE
jgi:putative ABC transport system permease protein